MKKPTQTTPPFFSFPFGFSGDFSSSCHASAESRSLRLVGFFPSSLAAKVHTSQVVLNLVNQVRLSHPYVQGLPPTPCCKKET